MLVCLAFVAPGTVAHASSSIICSGYNECADQGYSHYGYKKNQSTSYWRMYGGTNCTNYAAYRLVTTNGMPNTRPNSGVGNARDWGKAMSSITDQTPIVGSVAWWHEKHSHVAYVEEVISSTEILVSESNWSGAFDWRRVRITDRDWPDGFIHFADTVLINTTRPSIAGTVAVDSVLTAKHGGWLPRGGNSYRYQWRADDRRIDGATDPSFTPGPEYLGSQLAVRVWVSRPGYDTVRLASPKSSVAAGTLAAIDRPTISGQVRVDRTLTATPGTWSPDPDAVTFQWLADGSPIPDATGQQFALSVDHVGAVISVRTEATRAGYTTGTQESAATTPVARGTFKLKQAPSISGRAKVGRQLVADPGAWSPTGRYVYRWYADGRWIPGAKDATYRLTAAEKGKVIKVRVAVKREGYVRSRVRSAGTDRVR